MRARQAIPTVDPKAEASAVRIDAGNCSALVAVLVNCELRSLKLPSEATTWYRAPLATLMVERWRCCRWRPGSTCPG